MQPEARERERPHRDDQRQDQQRQARSWLRRTFGAAMTSALTRHPRARRPSCPLFAAFRSFAIWSTIAWASAWLFALMPCGRLA